MAYKGRRVKKNKLLKNPLFWAAIVAVILILLLVVWVWNAIAGLDFAIRTPDPTTLPVSQERPTEPTEETAPTPPANPYGPVDFDLNEETGEITLASGNAVKGIDVSSWQGKINWKKVKDAGVEFVIIRVGGRGTASGELYDDEKCQDYYKGAKKAGLKVGAYVFAQSVTEAEAVEEAKFLLSKVKTWDIDMPLVYDWEYVDEDARTADVTSRQLTDMAKAFCKTIEDAGYQPMIYFGASQSEDRLILGELVDYPFWLAMYTTIMDYPHKVQMWQYTDQGKLPGISGNVDLNLWFTYDE